MIERKRYKERGEFVCRVVPEEVTVLLELVFDGNMKAFEVQDHRHFDCVNRTAAKKKKRRYELKEKVSFN